ncbi:MAG: DNA polymerase I [Acidobacteriota bacterium]
MAITTAGYSRLKARGWGRMVGWRMHRLLLVDGHSNLYRAFYAIRAPLTAPDGTPTGAAFGFLLMQHKLLRDLRPTHVAVAFDSGRETFRTRMDERYKAQRPAMPDDLEAQIPLALEALRLLGVAVLQQEDVEADDIIGTLARDGAEAGFEVVIASTDKDLMQLVRDPSVKMWHTRLERMLDERGVEEVFGVPPSQVAEVLAIMGDSSDNVPGCRGIGEKGARELIRRWGSVAEVYAHFDEITPPRARTALGQHRADVELSRELVRIRTDLELGVEPGQFAVRSPSRAELAGFYRRLGFTSLLGELAEEGTGPTTATVAVETGDLAALAARLAAGERCAVALSGGSLAVCDGGGCLQGSGEPAALAALLAPHLGRIWCHDAKALLAAVRDSGAEPAGSADDTMLAGYLLAPGDPVDLVSVCGRVGVAGPIPRDDPAAQAEAVTRAAPALVEHIAAAGLERVYRDLERPLVPVLEAMERRGIRLDTGALAGLSRRLEASLAELEREIHDEAGEPFNLNSPQQLAHVLFTVRGLPVLRKTSKTRLPSTDADVLAELAARGHRLPALLLDYREQAKLKSTYVDALPRQVAADGRVHTRFNQAVAATGRLSSSDPNLQNIPIRTELGREVRRAFVADPGHVLLAADYSQVELRVLAHLSEDPSLELAFAAGEDIHRATASLVFGLAPELVSAEHRRAAKTINFGLVYGMSTFSLARDLGVGNAEAQAIVDAYFERMPRVREFLEATKESARKTGMVSTLFGRIRRIAGLDARNAQVRGNAERMAINAPVQGTAADLIKLAMIRLAAELAERRLPAALLLQVHDELILEVASEAVDHLRDLARSVMETVVPLRVPLKVDIGVGTSWADAKE